MNGFVKADDFFTEIGITKLDAENRLSGIRPNDGKYFSKEGSRTGFLMPLYFSAVSLLLKDVANILEIGTGSGNFTSLLANLFPSATVYTIDIPVSDKEYATKRGAWRRRGMAEFEKNVLNKSNVKFIEKNSFFLPSMGLPQKFGFIYVDGGHWYPVVAWDIMFAYHRLRPDGFAFFHDYGDGVTDVNLVLEYIKDLIDEEIKLVFNDTTIGIKNAAWFRKLAGEEVK